MALPRPLDAGRRHGRPASLSERVRTSLQPIVLEPNWKGHAGVRSLRVHLLHSLLHPLLHPLLLLLHHHLLQLLLLLVAAVNLRGTGRIRGVASS